MKNYKKMTDYELYRLTVLALNDGSDIAMQDAWNAKQESHRRNNEATAQIDYLWEVI